MTCLTQGVVNISGPKLLRFGREGFLKILRKKDELITYLITKVFVEQTRLYGVYLVDPCEARGCSTNTVVINWFTDSSCVKIYSWRCHAQTVLYGDLGNKIDYVKHF